MATFLPSSSMLQPPRFALLSLDLRTLGRSAEDQRHLALDAVARLLDLAAVGVAHEVEKGIPAARLTRPVVDGVDADLVEDLLLGRRMAEEGEHHRERGLLARQVVLLVVHGHVDGDRWRARW